MKRIATIFFVALMLLVGGALAENSNTAKPTSKPKPKVDCSRTDDATITNNVKERVLSLSDLSAKYQIELTQANNVFTRAGVVTLRGTVKNETQKATVGRIAKSVPCVKKVENKITVEKPPAPKPKNAAPEKTRNANKI